MAIQTGTGASTVEALGRVVDENLFGWIAANVLAIHTNMELQRAVIRRLMGRVVISMKEIDANWRRDGGHIVRVTCTPSGFYVDVRVVLNGHSYVYPRGIVFLRFHESAAVQSPQSEALKTLSYRHTDMLHNLDGLIASVQIVIDAAAEQANAIAVLQQSISQSPAVPSAVPVTVGQGNAAEKAYTVRPTPEEVAKARKSSIYATKVLVGGVTRENVCEAFKLAHPIDFFMTGQNLANDIVGKSTIGQNPADGPRLISMFSMFGIPGAIIPSVNDIPFCHDGLTALPDTIYFVQPFWTTPLEPDPKKCLRIFSVTFT